MNRSSLKVCLELLAFRAFLLPPARFNYLVEQLQRVEWMRHVTDQIERCTICDVEDAHASDCPVRLLEPTSAAASEAVNR
jgi:hypothetical protein